MDESERWNEHVFYGGEVLTRRALKAYLLNDGYSRQYAIYHALDAMSVLPHEEAAMQARVAMEEEKHEQS